MKRRTMTVKIDDRENSLGQRLRARLDEAAALRCPDHDESVESVVINGRGNGWFDTRWTTCCETLERQAAAIVKERC